jgi:hypothetical protein
MSSKRSGLFSRVPVLSELREMRETLTRLERAVSAQTTLLQHQFTSWELRHNPRYQEPRRKLGYALVGCELCGTNAFFVRTDLVGEHFCAPFTAENHYEPPRYWLARRDGHPRCIAD